MTRDLGDAIFQRPADLLVGALFSASFFLARRRTARLAAA